MNSIPAKPPFTMALSYYDRHVPFFDGAVSIADGVVEVLDVGQTAEGRHGRHREERMLQDGEFSIAEVSFTAYLMAKMQGAAFTAIPVFPVRLFTPSRIWVRRNDAITDIRALAHGRIGIRSHQHPLAVMAKDDWSRHFGLPEEAATWISVGAEPLPGGGPGEVRRDGKSLTELLVLGEIDAIIVPHAGEDLWQHPKIRRLFEDPRDEEARYLAEWGYYPLAHVMIFRDEVLSARPDLAMAVFESFERAFARLWKVQNDPNWSSMVWSPLQREDEMRRLSRSLWENGIRANRRNLERLIRLANEQGLISRTPPLESLFHESTWRT